MVEDRGEGMMPASPVFTNQAKQGEFELYCPLCGGWLHAYHLGDPEPEETCCLDCEIGITMSFDSEKNALSITVDDGSTWTFEHYDGKTSGSK